MRREEVTWHNADDIVPKLSAQRLLSDYVYVYVFGGCLVAYFNGQSHKWVTSSDKCIVRTLDYVSCWACLPPDPEDDMTGWHSVQAELPLDRFVLVQCYSERRRYLHVTEYKTEYDEWHDRSGMGTPGVDFWHELPLLPGQTRIDEVETTIATPPGWRDRAAEFERRLNIAFPDTR
jgi:hypothetical protein